MRKRFITLLLAIVMVITLLVVFASCDNTNTNTITSTKTEVGSYSIYQTKESQKYLNFLEEFDETKYEIVDISTSMNTAGYGSGEFYMVTYKKIAE